MDYNGHGGRICSSEQNNFWLPKHLLPQYNRITHTASEYIEKNQRQMLHGHCRRKRMDKTMKFISWNVNGLRACMQKGFLDFFNEVDADFFCVQETKLQEGQIALDLPGYHQFWNYAEKRLFRHCHFYKHEPLSVSYGIGIPEHDHEGVSSHWNTMLFIWLPVTLRIPRTNWQDFLTACSGKKIFLPFWKGSTR